MIALDLLGAGEKLATQTILVRIKSIDVEKLRESLKAGTLGVALGPALAAVDQFPKLSLDMALPIAKTKLTSMGVDADLSVADAVAPAPRAASEAGPGLAVGVVLGIALAFAGRWAYNRVVRKGAEK